MNGSLIAPNGVFYTIRGNVGNLTIVKSSNSEHLQCGGCHVEKTKLPRDPRLAAQPVNSWRNGDANLIDLLLVYPTVVKTEAGGATAVESTIASSVSDANLCYQNSLVPIQLRVVHIVEINYTPTGILNTELDRLKNPNDGYFDNIHSLRDQYGADLVCMLTTQSDSGGLASTMTHPKLSFESSGFNVNVWGQIGAPSYTLAHEIGHNMGCLHNREDSTWDVEYEFSAFCFGKRWMEGGQGYKTIMSYDTNPSSTFPNSIPYFSNPSVSYLTTSTGNIGTENNAKVLGLTAPFVSNFRKSIVQAVMPNVFNLQVVEGNASSLKVRLAVEPTSSVEVNATINGNSDFFVSSPASLLFTQANWNIGQTVQVSAQPDSDLNNDSATLILSSSGLASSNVQITESDTGNSLETNFLITGLISSELGIGLSGVSLAFSNGGGSFQSDENGSFRKLLSSGWSGSLTPNKTGYTFTPSSITISPLSANSVGHRFTAVRSNILYVDHDASGHGDGTNWANAYVNLSDALLSQNIFNEVWVAEGTYLPGDVRPSSFILPPNIAVYGGFSGNETSRNERNASAHLTVLSGDIGTPNNVIDNSYHVVIPSTGSTLSGFTIRDGNANRNYTNDDRGKGAGLWADSSNIIISDCNFSNNISYQGGAGVYLKEVNASFLNCVFSTNTTSSTGSGGGAFLKDSNVSFQNTIFLGNEADFNGGAIKSDNTILSLVECTFTSNRSVSSNGGGAVYQLGGSYTINSSSFRSNRSTFEGGALLLKDSNGTIVNSNFISNQSTQTNGGGAVYISGGNYSVLGSSFSLNHSAYQGGGMAGINASGSILDSNFTGNQNSNSNGAGALFLENSSPLIKRCNFTENFTTANNYGGAIKLKNSSPNISDSIFIRNRSQANSAGALYIDSASAPTFSRNEFQYNSAAQFGGAIFVDSQNLNMNGDLFLGNFANFGGGVATQGGVSISMSNVRVIGNEANSSSSSTAGFMYLNSGVTGSTFVNCVFSGNKSLGRYGVYRPSGLSRFVNCSFSGNQAVTEGGITLMFSGDSIQLDNCIVWGNSGGTGNDLFVNAGTASANYSLFNPSESIGTISGSNNLNTNPLFTNANGGDGVFGTLDDNLTLQSSSPAINQATVTSSNYPTTDLLGNARYGTPDQGAYEFLLAPHTFDVNGTNYEVIKQNATWSQAAQIAAARGGMLAEIKGSQEQSAIFVALGNAGINISDTIAPDGGGGAYVWIGGNDLTNEGDWSWDGNNDGNNIQFWTGASNGSQVGSLFNNWGSLQSGQNEPDDYLNKQDALAISLNGWPLGTAGQWNDLDQNNTLFFIVEYNAPPVFTSANSFTVLENQINAGQVTTTDPNGDTISYSITGGNDQSKFSINQTTGLLNFLSLPDFETPSDSDSNNVYELIVQVSDGLAQISQSILIVVSDVSEGSPNTTPSNLRVLGNPLSVPENSPIGTTIGFVTATDPDTNSTLNYFLVVGAGSSSNQLFNLETNGTLLTATSLDYEANASHSIRVRVSDELNASIESNFTIGITDLNETTPQVPQFEFNATALQIPEDASIGRDVGSVYRVSGDMNQSVVFSLEQNGSAPIPFSVESNGTVLVAGALDYEQNASYPIHIRGTEGNRTLVHHYQIYVRDVFEMDINSAPTDISILSQNLEIKGNLDAGIEVGSLRAIDSDVDDIHTFHLIKGSGGFDNSFFVMESNGTLRTSMLLDLGSDQNLSIRTRVIDSKGSSYEKVFTVSYQHQQAGEDTVLLSEGAEVVPGWKRAGWFGFYFADFYPWVYHENLGWIYVSEKTIDGAWFFRERLGWIWTSPEIFPALFQYEKSQWTYLDTSNPMTILFDYDRMEWFFLDRDYEITGLSNPATGGYVKGLGIYERGQTARIEAVPTSGYLFVEWKGDLVENTPMLNIQVFQDFKLEAVFKPILSSNASPEEAIGNAIEAIDSIEGLSPELKQKALAELLLTGQSSTADIKGTGQ